MSSFSHKLFSYNLDPELPLPANILIFLGVLVLVTLIFLVIGVLHYCFWRQPPPPEDPPAFDMNMDYGGRMCHSSLHVLSCSDLLQGRGRPVQRGGGHILRGAGGQGQELTL